MKTFSSVLIGFAFTLAIGVCFSSSSLAQPESSAFTLTGMAASTPFARDYQALSINPANLDFETGYEQRSTMGLFDFTASVYTELLTKQEIMDNILRKKKTPLTYDEQLAQIDKLTMKQSAVDLDIMTFGNSIRTKKSGTFAFGIRDRVDYYTQLDRQLTELIWMGNQSSYFDSLIIATQSGRDSIIARPDQFNPDQFTILQAFIAADSAPSVKDILGNSKLGFTWYREFNAAWGKRLLKTDLFDFHIGIGAKLMIGQGIIQVDGATGEAYSSLSPIFKFDYSQLENAPDNPSALSEDAPNLKPVGKGVGFDLGASMLVAEHFILNAAINDIGEMVWDGNIYELADGKLTDFDGAGLESLDFGSMLNNFDGLDALLVWKGAETRTTRLNTTARLGIGYEQVQKLRIGFDVVAPMNDNKANLQRAVYNAGIEFTPWPWLHLQTGFSTGGNYASKLSAGIYFTAAGGGYEFGVATRDMLTFFNDENPTLSFALGFLRFRY
ncbi:MAG: DUF5723 family protein [Flavobacteriales bacterium]|jgi:hypothetical protein